MKNWCICRIIISLGIVFASVGCGGDTGPKVVPVSGTVTVGGSQPFAKGFIRFAPVEGSKKILGGSATTDDQGNFTIRHTSLRSGVEPGEYNVYFSLMKKPDGSPLPDQSKESDPKSPQELGGVEFVPLEYSTMTSQKYITKVSSSGGTFKFDIPELKPQSTGKAAVPIRRSNSD